MSSRRRASLLLLVLVPLAACGPNPVTGPCGPGQDQPPQAILGPDDLDSSCPAHHLTRE